MKKDLSDITFIILVRLDSIQRLENLLIVTELLNREFKTNICIREAASYNTGILQKLLKSNIRYEFVEDKDPVLYKTLHINQMASQIKTPYLAIWDADIVPDEKAILACIEELRKQSCDLAFPYDGKCYNVSAVIKSLFSQKKDIRILLRHRGKMALLYDHELVGGAVMMNRESYIQSGMENEKQYGWGNDDWDRYVRFVGLGYIIYRKARPLFHLFHPRGENSLFRSSIVYNISTAEYLKNKNSSTTELKEYIRKW